MKISLICVTNRTGALDILAECVDRQTFDDFEVIVANDSDETMARQNWCVFKPRQKSNGEVWNLNKAYNDCLDRAKGDLLVFLQDFIWIPDDALGRFWTDYQQYPNAIITGVGHKAKDGLTGISELDPRVDGPPGLSACDYMHVPWELNWAACPRKLMPRFNEMMDKYYGGENLYIQKAAILSGATMMIDRSNVCIGYSQEYCGGRPVDWEPKHANKDGRLAAFLHYLDILHQSPRLKETSGKQ